MKRLRGAIGEFKSMRVMTRLARRISIAVSGFEVRRVWGGGEGSDCQEVAKETSFADEQNSSPTDCPVLIHFATSLRGEHVGRVD